MLSEVPSQDLTDKTKANNHMAITRTASLKLQKPAVADRNWGPALNGNADALDGLAPLSALAVTTAESPSATRGLAVAAGPYLKPDGTTGQYAGGATTAAASATSHVSLNPATGAIVVGASWPSTPHVRLAVVVADATTITSVADARCVLNVTLGSAVTLPAATATGSYGANEQAMLQAVYDAVQKLVGG